MISVMKRVCDARNMEGVPDGAFRVLLVGFFGEERA